MQDVTALIWSRLNILTFKRYEYLCEKFGDLDSALPNITPEVLSQLGCREETVINAMNRLQDFDAPAYLAEMEKKSVHIISVEDERYPPLLKTIADPPVFLHAIGDISVAADLCVGLVGTRQMSSYGKRVTEAFVPEIVRNDIVTVSGLALGIDACVAQETLNAGGRTIAVLGGGFASISPKANAKLAKDIVTNGGLLLTEFPLDAIPDKYTFPARNRIIAGLSVATVVLEAGLKSGALMTAEFALEYGREVFAVPGAIFDENYAGCHSLISKGHAQLVTDASGILVACGMSVKDEKNSKAYEPVDENERKVYEALSAMPQSVSALAEATGIELSLLNVSLTMLELAGAAKNTGNGMWVRC